MNKIRIRKSLGSCHLIGMTWTFQAGSITFIIFIIIKQRGNEANIAQTLLQAKYSNSNY